MGMVFTRGMVTGAALVSALWFHQYHSLRNQEISHYIQPGELEAQDFVEAPSCVLPKASYNVRKPYALNVEGMG
jgi:hypothetical protein